MKNVQMDNKEWIKIVSRFNKPDVGKSIWQIINSFVPYLLLWPLMYYSLQVSYLLTLALAILTAGFQVRMFIIFHDCGHGSFFRSKRVNKIVGTIMGSLTFTPYDYWHKEHHLHHNTVGNLDKRGHGDVMTLTVKEYQAMSTGKKLYYRIYRNPVTIFLIAPFILFVLWFRIPKKSMTPSEKWSVYTSNLIIAAFSIGMILLMGWKAFLIIQIPVIYFATMAGVWLFYVQHQFEDVIWTRQEKWDYKQMALEGSSFLKFPRVLQWFSGNIGFHHIHHLSPKIPNYNLEKCHNSSPLFETIKPVTFTSSMRTINLRLWDEDAAKLISFRHFRKFLVSG